MGMVYGAGFAITIEKGILEKIGLASYNNFIKTLKDEDIDLSEFAVFSQHEDLSYVIKMHENPKKTIESMVENDKYKEMYNVAMAYLEFVKEFNDKYNMLINLGFHDSEMCGDRYDDVDREGYYIDFYDVFTETKEAKKFQEEADVTSEYGLEKPILITNKATGFKKKPMYVFLFPVRDNTYELQIPKN